MPTTNASSAFPALVMIIRHAEKPGAPESDDDTRSPDLSVRGSARAAALPALFTPDSTGAGTPARQQSCQVGMAKSAVFSGAYQLLDDTLAPAPRFPVPQHLRATQTSKNSNRPIETLTPTAQALGLEIHAKHADKDFLEVANEILRKHVGEVVLICTASNPNLLRPIFCTSLRTTQF